MELHLHLDGGANLAGQVYRGISAAIVDGRLRHGQQLPPSRLLAEQLGISRKPVSDAYAKLTHDRLVVGHIGKGSFVNSEPRAADAERQYSAQSSNATLEY